MQTIAEEIKGKGPIVYTKLFKDRGWFKIHRIVITKRRIIGTIFPLVRYAE